MIKINKNSTELIKEEIKKGNKYMLSILESDKDKHYDKNAPYFSIFLEFKLVGSDERFYRERYDCFGNKTDAEIDINNLPNDVYGFSYYLLTKEEADPYLKNLIVLNLEKSNL